MSALIPICEIEHAHLVVCKGKPDSPEDVCHYYVPCRRCGAPLKLRPIFMDKEGGELCYDCAEKKGFDTVTHENMSFWKWHEEIREYVRVKPAFHSSKPKGVAYESEIIILGERLKLATTGI